MEGEVDEEKMGFFADLGASACTSCIAGYYSGSTGLLLQSEKERERVREGGKGRVRVREGT